MTARKRTRARGTDKRLLLPVTEVAELLGVSRSTVVRAYEAGEFPVVKFRGTYRVPRRFIERLLASAVPGTPVIVEDAAAEWMKAVAS